MIPERAFIAAILADSEDDAPRLIYADWLDENGQSERAEFIRVQIEREAIPRKLRMDGRRREYRRYYDLEMRERELEPLCYDPDNPFRKAGIPVLRDNVRRGFVWRAECTSEQWLRHAGNCWPREGTDDPAVVPGTILAAEPVEEVTLATMPDGSASEKWARIVVRHNATCNSVVQVLQAEWPRIKTWRLPQSRDLEQLGNEMAFRREQAFWRQFLNPDPVIRDPRFLIRGSS